MIVYRVSKGLGWEQTTSEKLTIMSQIAFAERQLEDGSDAALIDETQDTSKEPQECKHDTGIVFALPMA